MELRNHGPGKFDLMVDAYVFYQLSLDGCDDQAGDVIEAGLWAGLIRNPGEGIPDYADLTDAEKQFLRHQAGCIITEDDCGFVTVHYFEDRTKLDRAWAKILKEFDQEVQE